MLKYLYYVLIFVLICHFSISEAKDSKSKRKHRKEQFQIVENQKPSSKRKTIENAYEKSRELVDQFDGDGWHSHSWIELRITYNVEFSDGSKSQITAVWNAPFGQHIVNRQPIEEAINTFYLERGDQIEFSLFQSDVFWRSELGNGLHFKIFRDGERVDIFQGYYRSPGANWSWD